jgi:hypothetical protein
MSLRPLLAGAALALALAAPARADDLVADDQIVQGLECAGLDCVGNEAFGTDTLRLKENNTRLAFDDTTSGGPANDWEVTANDSGSGGASYLAVTDKTTSRLPLRVMGASPTDALVLRPDGDVELRRGTLVARVNGTSTENAAAFDGTALLSALRTLPLSTYGRSGARHIGPMGDAFDAAFGLGGGPNVALGDLTGVALAAAKQLASEIAAASPGERGPVGPPGDSGPKGATGDTGPAGAGDADHDPTAAQLATFNARLERLAAGQTTERRRMADIRKRIER